MFVDLLVSSLKHNLFFPLNTFIFYSHLSLLSIAVLVSQGNIIKHNDASQGPSGQGTFLLFPKSHENRKQLPSLIETEPVRAGWDLTDPLAPCLLLQDETRPREQKELAGSSHSWNGGVGFQMWIFLWCIYYMFSFGILGWKMFQPSLSNTKFW